MDFSKLGNNLRS